MKLHELMTREVRTCAPDAPVADAARIMAELNCGAVPVVKDQRVIGIVTDRDIVLRAVAKWQDGTAKVEQCMTGSVVTASPDMDAHVAADLMAQRQIRRLPVVENDRLVGIVALGDLATVDIHINEAGDALSQISTPSRPGAH